MCSRLCQKPEVKESLTTSLSMSDSVLPTGLLGRMPSSWEWGYFNPSHQPFDSSYGIIYNFASWGKFLSYSTGHSCQYFYTSRRYSLLPNYTFSVPTPCSFFQALCYEQHDICHWNIYTCCLQCSVFPWYSCGPSDQWLYWEFTEMESTEVMQGLVLACWVNSDYQHYLLEWIFVGIIILRDAPSSIRVDSGIILWTDLTI